MATVNTVLGPVDSAGLGFTLTHEHVMVTSPGISRTFPEFTDFQGVKEDGVEALKEAFGEGVRTIVDLTTFDNGRDVDMLEEVSRRTGVHIIAATGSHQWMPRVFWDAKPDVLAPLFIREIEEGIDGTGIKAGVIKVASDEGGINAREEIMLRAAARTQKQTGVPISTHTWAPGRIGDEQIRVLEEEGVDLDRVYIGHSNDTNDTDYLLGMLKKGVWVGLDRYPGGFTHPGTPFWEERTEVAKRLMDAGYTNRIMLSHDFIIPRCRTTKELQEERRIQNPDNYLFITRVVLPRLKELGASDQDIHTIMVENPRRFFEVS